MASARHVHIEGLQTALPTRKVEPGLARPVSVAAPPLPAAALQRRARVVLYYRAEADGAAAPWGPEEALLAKESLSEAVADHPEMAGRLRRRADGSWEVKLNDTGVRLVLATAEATVDDFVGAGAGREAALAPWTDVDAEDPDMCALCFVQVRPYDPIHDRSIGRSYTARRAIGSVAAIKSADCMTCSYFPGLDRVSDLHLTLTVLVVI